MERSFFEYPFIYLISHCAMKLLIFSSTWQIHRFELSILYVYTPPQYNPLFLFLAYTNNNNRPQFLPLKKFSFSTWILNYVLSFRNVLYTFMVLGSVGERAREREGEYIKTDTNHCAPQFLFLFSRCAIRTTLVRNVVRRQFANPPVPLLTCPVANFQKCDKKETRRAEGEDGREHRSFLFEGLVKTVKLTDRLRVQCTLCAYCTIYAHTS